MKDGLLMKGGGHAMAAGVTLRKERLAEFRAFMESALAHDVAQSRHENELFIDGAVSARAVTPELGQPQSRRAVRRAIPSRWWRCRRISWSMPMKSGRRICGCGSIRRRFDCQRHRVSLDRPETRQRPDPNRGQPLHVAGSLAVDRWQGTERVQLRVLDVAVPDLGPAVIR